jgi:hypothetical protein
MRGFSMTILPLLIVLVATPAIGSVSAVGNVELRGVRAGADGTVFAGDRVRVGRDAYAKLSLNGGARFQLGAGTDVTILGDAGDTKESGVRMESGNVGFTAEGETAVRVHILAGNYDMTAEPHSAGNVVFSGPEAFGVRVIRGSVRVRNTKTQESFVVRPGSERLMVANASVPPRALPAFPSAKQPTKGPSNRAWIAIAGIVGGTATAIAILTSRNDERAQDPESNLERTQYLETLNRFSADGSKGTAVGSAVGSTAASAATAIGAADISPSAKAVLLSQANSLISRANSLLQQRAAADAQLRALQTVVQNQTGGPTLDQTAQLLSVVGQTATLNGEFNRTLEDLLALLEQARQAGVPNVPPNPPVQPAPVPPTALPPPPTPPGPLPPEQASPILPV